MSCSLTARERDYLIYLLRVYKQEYKEYTNWLSRRRIPFRRAHETERFCAWTEGTRHEVRMGDPRRQIRTLVMCPREREGEKRARGEKYWRLFLRGLVPRGRTPGKASREMSDPDASNGSASFLFVKEARSLTKLAGDLREGRDQTGSGRDQRRPAPRPKGTRHPARSRRVFSRATPLSRRELSNFSKAPARDFLKQKRAREKSRRQIPFETSPARAPLKTKRAGEISPEAPKKDGGGGLGPLLFYFRVGIYPFGLPFRFGLLSFGLFPAGLIGG